MNVFDKLWKTSDNNEMGDNMSEFEIVENIAIISIEPEHTIVVPEKTTYGSVTNQCKSFTGYNQVCYIQGQAKTIRSILNKQGFGCTLSLHKEVNYWPWRDSSDNVWEVTTKRIGFPVGHGPCTPL